MTPKPGDIWEHQEGGYVYVLRLLGDRVQVQRRPPGDSLAEPYWLRITTLQAIATHRQPS